MTTGKCVETTKQCSDNQRVRSKNIQRHVKDEPLVISPTSLALKVHLGMHDPHVSCKSVVSAEGLLLATELTSDLLLLTIVNSILVSRKIIWTTEDGIARLASAWIDARAFVRPGLRVAGCESTAGQTCAEIDRFV